MRIRALVAALAVVLLSAACSGGSLFRSYEYEEEMYLALDGTATLYVNSSTAALNALRGTALPLDPSVAIDKATVAGIYASPQTRVTRVTFSSRRNRRFVHVRMDVDNVTALSTVAPFAWSTYRLEPDQRLVHYRQEVGAAAGVAVGEVGWQPDDLVAFRIHLPSKIVYHNAGPENLRRGNILVWEQPLAARLAGAPLLLETRVESQSILYRTVRLFGATFAVVSCLFVFILWRVVKSAPKAVQRR